METAIDSRITILCRWNIVLLLAKMKLNQERMEAKMDTILKENIAEMRVTLKIVLFSPEDENGPMFGNVVFSSYSEKRTMDKFHKPSDSGWVLFAIVRTL
jgi:hypothetical protein